MDQSPPIAFDMTRYLEVRLFGARPHVKGRRIPVATIAHSAQRQQWDVAELAYQFALSRTEVLAALLYYEENKAAIEAQEAAYQEVLNEAQRRYDAAT